MTDIELAERYINNTNVSVFLTGKAGTGKTTFLRRLVETTHKRNVVLAPTGVAAVNAGGVTIHSFFQLPFCPYLPDVKELVTEYQMPEEQFKLRKNKINLIRTLDLLIIDEISMVRADLLDAVDHTLRRYRRSNKPFGGLQLLMIGDVQQLAPVVTDDEKPYMDKVYPSPFFFHSKALAQLPYITIQLTKVYRQQDREFLQILNNIRDNQFDTDTLKRLNSRVVSSTTSPLPQPSSCKDTNQSSQTEGAPPILLCTHNHQADSVNKRRLEALTTPTQILDAEVEGNFPDSSAPTDAHLQLKVGAQVMFIKNDTSGGRRYYNGKIGTITAFENDDEGNLHVVVEDEHYEKIYVGRERWENVKYELDSKDGQVKQRIDGTFTQYPLRTAWAITIHKAQGLTFDRVVIDAAQAFTYGQVYVALSRCRTLEGLTLTSPISSRCAFDCGDILQFNESFTKKEDAEAQLGGWQSQYYCEQLFELFDLGGLQRTLDELNSLFQRELRKKHPIKGDKLANANGQVIELAAVAERFRGQLRKIIASGEGGILTQETQELLNSRIAAASQYYCMQLAQIQEQVSEALVVDILNKATLMEFNDRCERWKESLKIKRSCMEAVRNNGYSVEQYQEARLSALLGDMVKTGKKKEERKSRGRKSVGEMTKATRETEKVKSKGEKKVPTWYRSAKLASEGASIEEIAAQSCITPSSVESHLLKAVEGGIIDVDQLIDNEELEQIVRYMLDEQPETLTAVYEHFEGQYSYFKLRLARHYAKSL